jgi:DNA-binding transcriptional LysR family regulator
MATVDANLLLALDALLSEGSVVGAARRMNLSPTAMSRTLARLREATGDALFVRAGQRMVPTSRAVALRARVAAAAAEVRGILRPDEPPDLQALERVFTIRANDDVAFTLGPALDAAVAKEAPKVLLRIVFGRADEADDESLRAGEIDLDVGIVKGNRPEMRVQTLYHDTAVVVVRQGHPLARKRLTLRAFVEAPGHVSCSRAGTVASPFEARLKELGVTRRIELVLPTFVSGAWLAAGSDRIVVMPKRLAAQVAPALRLRILPLPFAMDPLAVHQSWHPRLDGDAGHAWLRQLVRRVCVGKRGAR